MLFYRNHRHFVPRQTIVAMKLAAILIFVGFMHASAKSKAQYVTMSGKDLSLEMVFQKIQNQTPYVFFYDAGLLKYAHPVTVYFKDVPLEKALSQIFKNQPLTYRMVETTITVVRRAANNIRGLKNTTDPVLIDVRGVVTDENGIPLEGVSVFIKGNTIGVSTNSSGEYSFTNVDENAVLIFSSIGYESRSIRIRGRTIINISLQRKIVEQEEVVVTGYYQLPKERATGSYTHVDNKELEAITSLSLKDKLEGMVPGLLFEPNYNADQNPTTERSSGIVIRGQSTLGDNTPLIVVDGFPVIATDGVDPWSAINPDDVKSITVLKDAAAASIWGAQAANGVIVITTKKGNAKEGSFISINMEYLSQREPDLYEIPFASSKEAIDIYKYLFFETDYFDRLETPFFRNRYEFPKVIDLLVQMKTNEITEAEGNQKLADLSKIDARDEFSDLFFQPESHKKVTLAFQNNSRMNNFRASLMELRSNEFAIGDGSNQVIGNINNKFSPVDWFSVSIGANLSFKNSDNNGVDIRDLQYIPQMSRILDDNGDYLPMIKQNDDFYYDIPTEKRMDLVEQYDLPYDWNWNLKRDIDNKNITTDRNDIRLNGTINLKPFKGLDVDLSYRYQNNKSLYSNYMNPETWYVRNAVLENYRKDDGSFPVPVGGMLYERRSSFTSHGARFQLTYANSFGDHSIRGLAGTEIRKDYRESVPYGYYGYDPQSLTQITALNYKDEVNPKLTGEDEWRGTIPPIPTLAPTSINIGGRDDRFLSYYGNVGYTYKSRYDITGSIRLDQTNLYGRSASYRELPQWSLGAGYTISKEDFFNVKNINYLRFRIAYGFNGYIDKSASPYITGTPWIDPVNQSQYAAVLSTPNPALTWEKTANLNLGMDFGLLDNRIRGLVEVYSKKSTNVLADFAVNPTYGFYYDEATLNQGDINNNGIEIELSALILDRKFKWQSTINYSHNKNRVVNVNSTSNNMAARTSLSQFNPIAGQPVDYIAAAEWAGYNDEGLLQVVYQGKVQSILDIPYSGADLDALFNFVGQRSPKHYGSWINNLSYGNFELSGRFLYSFGNRFLNDAPPRSTLYNLQRYSSFFTFLPGLLVNRWQSPADNKTASMYGIGTRVASYTSTLTNDYLSEYNTRNVLNAGQIRLQSISLSYRIPEKFIGSFIQNARLQLQVRNLGPVFLVNDEGIDPSFPRYSGSLYSAYYNTIRDRPEYSIALRVNL